MKICINDSYASDKLKACINCSYASDKLNSMDNGKLKNVFY